MDNLQGQVDRTLLDLLDATAAALASVNVSVSAPTMSLALGSVSKVLLARRTPVSPVTRDALLYLITTLRKEISS